MATKTATCCTVPSTRTKVAVSETRTTIEMQHVLYANQLTLMCTFSGAAVCHVPMATRPSTTVSSWVNTTLSKRVSMFVLITHVSTTPPIATATKTVLCCMPLKWKADRVMRRCTHTIARSVALCALPLLVCTLDGAPDLARRDQPSCGKAWLPDHTTVTMVVALATCACTAVLNIHLDTATATKTATCCTVLSTKTKALAWATRTMIRTQHVLYAKQQASRRCTHNGVARHVQMGISQCTQA